MDKLELIAKRIEIERANIKQERAKAKEEVLAVAQNLIRYAEQTRSPLSDVEVSMAADRLQNISARLTALRHKDMGLMIVKGEL